MRTLIAATVALSALSHAARADNYFSVGVGSDAGLRETLDTRSHDAGSIGRIAFGHRTGPIAIEAAVAGSKLAGATGPALSSFAVGVDVKYHVALVGPLECYARGGISKNWIPHEAGSAVALDDAGRGYAVGGGVQYTLDVLPLVSAAVWLDYGRHILDPSDAPDGRIDDTADVVTLGVSVGAGLF